MGLNDFTDGAANVPPLDSTHVYVDVTAAQAGRPAIDMRGGPIEQADAVDVATALRLSDDLRRAALTSAQLHEEFGDDRDPALASRRAARTQPTDHGDPF